MRKGASSGLLHVDQEKNFLVHWRRLYRRKAATTGTIVDKIIVVEETGKRSCLHLCRDALFQLSRFFKHKAEQNMVSSHCLAHVPNARTLHLHPGIDHCFQRRCAIPTLGAIKAFKPVHAHPLPNIKTLFACRSHLVLCMSSSVSQ
jgi:hypothetical protein